MTPRRRELLILGGVGVAAAAAGALLGARSLRSRSAEQALFSASFPDLAGKPRRLLEWQGKILLCNFWATWCAPCREEIPLLVEMHAVYANKGVQVVGIGIDQVAKMREFAVIFKVSYPLLVADASAIETMRQLGNASGGLPFNVIFDRAGKVAERKLGAFRSAEIRQAIDGLLS